MDPGLITQAASPSLLSGSGCSSPSEGGGDRWCTPWNYMLKGCQVTICGISVHFFRFRVYHGWLGHGYYHQQLGTTSRCTAGTCASGRSIDDVCAIEGDQSGQLKPPHIAPAPVAPADPILQVDLGNNPPQDLEQSGLSKPDV